MAWHSLVEVMLSVKYAPEVPLTMVEIVEHHARTAGLSLEAVEVIGASLDFVESFIVAVEDGQLADFLATTGISRLPVDKVALARWQAERLFGAEA